MADKEHQLRNGDASLLTVPEIVASTAQNIYHTIRNSRRNRHAAPNETVQNRRQEDKPDVSQQTKAVIQTAAPSVMVHNLS